MQGFQPSQSVSQSLKSHDVLSHSSCAMSFTILYHHLTVPCLICSELVSSSGSNLSSNGIQPSGPESGLSVQPFPGSSSSSEGSSPDALGLPPFQVEEGHSDSVFDPPYAVRQEYPKDR